MELAASNNIGPNEEIRDIIFEEEPRFTFFRFVHDYKGKETTSLGITLYSLTSLHIFMSGILEY